MSNPGVTGKPVRGVSLVRVGRWWGWETGEYENTLNLQCEVEASLVLFPEPNVRWGLVQPNTKPLQFVFNQFLVLQWLQYIQNNEDETAGTGHCNHLATTPLPIFCSLDDPREI